MASSPSRAPRQKPAADLDTRRRILRGALEVFGARGFDGARTRDIADAAGVNLGLLQYHFGGKEKLWRATVDDAFGELWTALGAAGALDAADPAALAEIVRVAVRFAAAHPALVRLMNDEGKRSGPRLAWLVDRHGRRLYETMAAVLGRARAAGVVADVDPIHLYYVFIGGAGLIFSQAAECRRLAGVDPTASPAMIEAHAEALVRLLVGPAAVRRTRGARRGPS
jgi:AcrR family transcriptional regulator